MDLEPAEFNLLWRALDLPARPLVLNVPEQGATLAEAASVAARAADTLRARGLLLAADEPAGKVAGPLTDVASPAAEVDLRWSPGAGSPELRGMVAMRGKNDVLALWNGERIRLRRVRHDVFAEELAAVLDDDTPPGEGRSVTAPAGVLRNASRAGGDPARFHRRLIAAGVSRDDARAWREFVEAHRHRAGQIGATAYDDLRRPTRAPWVIHVLDTERGRYATYERGGHRTVVGVDSGWLATVIRELYLEATGNHRNW